MRLGDDGVTDTLVRLQTDNWDCAREASCRLRFLGHFDLSTDVFLSEYV